MPSAFPSAGVCPKNAFNVALLPEIHGDAQDLRHVIDKMNREITELRRRDADTFFS